MIVLISVKHFGSHDERCTKSSFGQITFLQLSCKPQICNLYLERSLLLSVYRCNNGISNVVFEVEVTWKNLLLRELAKVDKNIVEFQVSVHHILGPNSHKPLHDLLQESSCLNLWQETIASFEESVDVATVAVLHDQIVVWRCFGSCDQTTHVTVLNLSHYLYFIHE